ncbi:UDP-3-O-(3-hydroxymyristoyl)glucosamine N-acyltransferase [Thiomicrospira sp. R3]|uniref:UDP-3-O-(3-hydroxymyristoyl)glucosamine N-acyltransferase n=1 Tax=Thiomicrospira sp. R3 TaxID=3035472 RepID=UPI00259B6C0A|nr:UDP-3-O-(3-hydroxymyristoyl)glucosamine N-acyltransferase [Thiomicrospira sp. R3]WFE68349.1 UDP-3-O-(3-hydroxymyristoyl)glucosamine N-acyltransferase [Thiomicrospira sp. R3]
MVYTLQQLVEHLKSHGLDASVKGSAMDEVYRIQGLNKAQPGDLSFLSDKKYLSDLVNTQATAVCVKLELAESCPTNSIIVSNPYAAYALVAQKMYGYSITATIASSAVISATASLSDNVFVGEGVVIGENVMVEEGVVIGPGCVIESGVRLGEKTRLAPNVTIMHDCVIGKNCIVESGAVIGGDGFGWARHQGTWLKIPQIGRVVIGDSVSIGNNTTIDRGAIDDTVIEDNCIIDNLVHIAHNVKIGEGTAIAGQVGFAGSAVVGKNCTFAGQTAMVGHIELADGVTIMGRGVATHSIHQSGVYSGFPAVPIAQWQKNAIYAKNLGKFSDKIKQINQRLKQLETGER